MGKILRMGVEMKTRMKIFTALLLIGSLSRLSHSDARIESESMQPADRTIKIVSYSAEKGAYRIEDIEFSAVGPFYAFPEDLKTAVLKLQNINLSKEPQSIVGKEFVTMVDMPVWHEELIGTRLAKGKQRSAPSRSRNPAAAKTQED